MPLMPLMTLMQCNKRKTFGYTTQQTSLLFYSKHYFSTVSCLGWNVVRFSHCCWLATQHYPRDGPSTYHSWPTSPCLPICINRSLDLTVTRQHRRGDVQPPCRNQATNPENGKLCCQSDKCVQNQPPLICLCLHVGVFPSGNMQQHNF